jgi:ribosomal protein L23
MTMIYEVLQTEKAYRTQEKNTYIITFKNNVTPTKVQVMQELKKLGLNPTKVNKVVPPRKTRSRNGRRTNITVRRPVKYFVTLKQGETLIQEAANEETTTTN